jgi:peptidoglycan/xylan/chitin deacetylase (PgdA/CDA1 family)
MLADARGTGRRPSASIPRASDPDAVCEDETVTARVASRRSVRLALLVGAALIPLLVATGLGDPTPPISLTVDGRPALVAAGSHLGALVREFDLKPSKGRLLDVHGHVIDRTADPGRILLDGHPAGPRIVLSDGDAITIVDGVDRTETTKRVRTRLPGMQPGNPQYSLATARMVRVDTVGRVSGIVVSTAYQPIGHAKRPPAVALTFDDGPWPTTTRRILGVLHRMRAKATFFVIGYLAKRYPALIRAERSAGMAIGSHSWDHPEPFGALHPRRLRDEMQLVSGMLRRRFGLRVTVFRSPGGSTTPAVVTTASRLGMRVVNWNVDPRDWSSGATPRSIVRAVLSNVEPGSIVDLHDGGGDQRATVKALPAIIRGIRRMGLKLVALR